MSKKNVLSGPNRPQIKERALALSEELADVEADLVAYLEKYDKQTINDVETEVMDHIFRLKEEITDILTPEYCVRAFIRSMFRGKS